MLRNWQLQLVRFGLPVGVLIGAVGGLTLPSDDPRKPILWAVGFLLVGVASAARAVNWNGVTDHIVANAVYTYGLTRDRQLALQRSIGKTGVAMSLVGLALAVALAVHLRP